MTRTKLLTCWMMLLMALGLTMSRSAHALCTSCYYYYSTSWGYLTAAYLPNGTFGATNTFTVDHSNTYNYAYRPVANRQNKLVLFLPGVGAQPSNYTAFYEEAVNQGYFVIGLDWLNDIPPQNMCSCNSTCEGGLDEQVVVGTNHNFYNVWFASGAPYDGHRAYNSIYNRLSSFLTWLQTADTTAGSTDWSQFWNGSEPYWSKIILAGHSEGGVVASWMLKNKGGIKALTFSSPSSRLDCANSLQFNSGGASTEWTAAGTSCSSSPTEPSIFTSFPASNLRAFVNYNDSRYTGNGTDCKDQSDNLSDILSGIGQTETQLYSTASCSTSTWHQWLTIMDVETTDPHEAHLSTIFNGTYGSTYDALRPCIWDFMLNN